MKYFSICTGIGGFELGIERATNGKWECVGYSKIDKYAIQTFQNHYPELKNFGDATKINADELPDFDMLCGGFPCQSFSIAGKRKGFQDTRGTLFHEILRIAKAKRPRLLFLENVKGLLSADDGRCFATIISSLDELGYDVEWQVLNSKNFGVPQNRERVFIIGHLRGEPFKQVFPIGEMHKGINERTAETSVNTITAGGNSGGLHSSMTILQLNNPNHSNDRVYSEEGISPSLNTAQGGNRQPKIIIPVLTPDRPEKRQNDRRFKDDGEEMFTLTGQDVHGIITHNLQPRSADRPSLKNNPNAGGSGHLSKDDGFSYCLDGINAQAIEYSDKIRRLTPVECERLQGFPDNWTIGSDTQRYKQCGNAVTVNVIQAIAKEIK